MPALRSGVLWVVTYPTYYENCRHDNTMLEEEFFLVIPIFGNKKKLYHGLAEIELEGSCDDS